MTKPNNPPAFPQQCADALDVGMVHEGMTLRDYFAGQALANIGIPNGHSVGLATAAESKARWAYQIADAMLAERERGQ